MRGGEEGTSHEQYACVCVCVVVYTISCLPHPHVILSPSPLFFLLSSSSLLPLSLLSKVVRKKTKCIFHTEDTSSLNDRNREAKSEVYRLTGYVLRASVVAVGVVVLVVNVTVY